MRRSSFSALAAVIATLSLAYIGCSEATTSTIVDSVASVLVTPGSATVQVNQTTQFTAVARGESGSILSGHSMSWSSSATSVATVTAAGVVQGVSAGHATITASSEGQSGSADVTVESTPVATITITPASPTIGVNGTVQLAAILKDANGNELSGRTVTWESSASGTASVSGAGLVNGVAAGQATITARSEGQSGSTTVTVQPLPPTPVASVEVNPASATVQVNGTQQLTATTRDAGGAVLTGRAVTWSTSAAGTATVSASGLVRGVAAGQVTITATSEGHTGTASITVQVAPVATVTVAPATPSIAINGTVQLSATLRDAGGNVLTGRSVTWSTSASGTATVSGSGLVTGVAAGQATITATSEGQTGTSTVTVQAPAPVATVTVTPSAPNVSIGASTQLTATLKDASGNVLTGRTVTWSSSATSIATVSSSGLVTGVAAGQATVTATSEGQSGTSTITVPAPPPPPSGTVADPTQLPLASGQSPPSGTYGRTLSAGQTYNDPVSGLPVLKVTDASTPISNSRGHHDYSEGGPYISQPWVGTDGNTYYTLMVAAEPNRYLVDVRYDNMTLSNWREIDLDGDLSFAFSLNPATPRIAFVELNSLSNVVQRYNTATNRVENTGNWPWRPAAGSINWLQTQLNDTWLVAMGNNVTIVAFRPSDGLMRSYSPNNLDEPHIDREQPFTYLALGNQVWVCNLTTGAACFNAPGDPSWNYQPNSLQNADHSAPLRGHIVGIANSSNLKYYSYDVLANVTSSYLAPSQAAGFPGEEHRSGVWVFNNGNGNTSQWWTIDPSGGTDSNAKIRSGMIGMVNIDGSATRIVAVHNSTGGQASYQTQPHTTLAPDGKWVMWSSDNKSGGRTDVYLVRMPTK